ncbi:MAG: LysR family transcriptional regulator [Cellvibrionaceae bacterium]|nr:LysR family transcriptional regulator [Cellvibrionaceae bacterium]
MRPDLNLLSALRVLLEERNVTHAAKRLHVSQPAMSKTLQKLREELNDPLFTRSSHGLIPTPRAKQLEQQLPDLLDQISNLVHPQEFIPGSYNGRFNIAGPGVILDQLIPDLSLALQDHSPRASLTISEVSTDFTEQLASGQLDFVIHINRSMPEELVKTSVGFGEVVCAMRADHPLAAQEQVSLEDYLSFPHVRLYIAQITHANIGVVDEILNQSGQQRDIVLETSSLSSALDVVAKSDCLLVTADNHKELQNPAYTYKTMPIELGYPTLEMVIIQHRRSINSQPHLWLRGVMADIMSNFFREERLFRSTALM